jgi:glucose-1-phosphate adenylyltransferase
VHSYALIESSVLMGGSIKGSSIQECAIGRGCLVRNAIVDRDVRLSPGTVIGHDRALDDRRGLKTHTLPGTNDYLVVVPKDFSL